MSEGKFQNEIVVPWLKERGAFVMKTRPGMGTPVGTPDIFFFKGEKWGCIECKASSSSPFRPLQKETLVRLAAGNEFVWAAWPENWDDIKEYLTLNFF